MVYYIGTENECINLNKYITDTCFNGWNYSNVGKTNDGRYYMAIRAEDRDKVPDEYISGICETVIPEEI